MSQYNPTSDPSQGAINKEIAKLWSAKSELDKTKSELNDALSQRSASPAESTRNRQAKDTEIERLNARIGMLKSQIELQERTMRNQGIKIEQQQETIRIQSEEITKQQNRSPRYEASPYRSLSQGQFKGPPPCPQSQQQISPYNQPPSRYGQPQITDPSPHHQGRPYNLAQHRRPRESLLPCHIDADHTKFGTKCKEVTGQNHIVPTPFSDIQKAPTEPAAMRKRANRRVTDEFGSPLQQMGQLAIGDSFTTPPSPRNHVAIGTNPAKQCTPDTSNTSSGFTVPNGSGNTPQRSPSVASTRSRSIRVAGAARPHPLGGNIQRDQQDEVITKIYTELLDMCLMFAYCYVNDPSSQGDANLDKKLKNHLMDLATKTTAARLLGSQNTRYFLVAKLIIQWIHDHVFSSSGFSGHDTRIDQHIIETRLKAYATGTAIAVKYLYLRDAAIAYEELTRTFGYRDFIDNISYQRAASLWDLIRPMMYVKRDGGWEDMHNLMQFAHRVAEMRNTDGAEWRLYYPAYNEDFAPGAMTAMNPEFDTQPSMDLMSQGALVNLGFSPQVMYKSAERGSDSITIIKAGVLVRFPEPLKPQKGQRGHRGSRGRKW